MTGKIIIIVGVSVVSVLAMFAMGWYLNRDDRDGSKVEGAGKEALGEGN